MFVLTHYVSWGGLLCRNRQLIVIMCLHGLNRILGLDHDYINNVKHYFSGKCFLDSKQLACKSDFDNVFCKLAPLIKIHPGL